MVYKYQEETIDEIKKIIDKLESMTEGEYRIKIGYRITNNGFERFSFPIFACVNMDYYFMEEDVIFDVNKKCEIEYAKQVHFNGDIFLKFNDLLDEIVKDNKERELLHDKINRELEILNKSL